MNVCLDPKRVELVPQFFGDFHRQKVLANPDSSEFVFGLCTVLNSQPKPDEVGSWDMVILRTGVLYE